MATVQKNAIWDGESRRAGWRRRRIRLGGKNRWERMRKMEKDE